MDQKIVVDSVLAKELKDRSTMKKIYENDASHFISGNFRSDVFNIKSYLTKSKKKDQILYIPINIPALISETEADFVVGDGITIEIIGSTDAKTKEYQQKWDDISDSNDFENLVHGIATSMEVYGYGTLRMRKEYDQIVIEEIPFVNYYPVLTGLAFGQQPEKIHIISEYVDPEDKSSKGKASISTYTRNADGKGWSVESGIYSANVTQILQGALGVGNEYKLETLSTKEPEKFTFLNVYRTDNKKKAGKVLGQHGFVNVMDLIEELNDRFTQKSVQFIKHGNAKLSLPASFGNRLNKEQKKITDVETFVHDQGEQPPQYIDNGNSLLLESDKHIDKTLGFISSLTSFPSSFLGVDELGSNVKVEVVKMKLMRFTKKIEKKQANLCRTVKRIVKDALTYSGVTDEFTINVKFSESMIRNLEKDVNTFIKLYESKLLSQKSAIGYAMDWDAAMVEDEIRQIDKENTLTPVPEKKDGNND